MNTKKSAVKNTRTIPQKLAGDFRMNWQVYLLLLPVILFYAIFYYKPMYGIILAFKEYSPAGGITGSEFIGLENFTEFFTSRFFVRVLKNTLRISLFTLLIGFPIPIIFALLLNEIPFRRFTKTVETMAYMPHFISLVVMCGLVREFVSDDGIITQLCRVFGYTGGQMLNDENLFVPIYIISGLWQEMGWGSIIYIAAILGVDKALYEAATIDGAGKLKQCLHITIPGIMPTIITMLILQLGQVMNVGFEKIILLYNPNTYIKADVISSYVYRTGLQDFRYGYSTAVGLFNSVINFGLVYGANWISRRANGTSLW